MWGNVRGRERHPGTVPPPFAVSDVATAAYCGRKAYLARDEGQTDTGERDGDAAGDERAGPPPEVRAVREFAYHYPALVEEPAATVERLCADRDVPLDAVDPAVVAAGLAERRGTSLWEAVVAPLREETVLRSDRFVGRVDKLLRLPAGALDLADDERDEDGAAVPSFVATGRPPTTGVWRTQRVRCAALVALVEAAGYAVDGRAVVEYPRVGALRGLRVGPRDRRGLEDAVATLDDAERGHPPSRTSNPSKCNACRFRERCGVPTRSLRSRLADRLGVGADD